MIIEGQRRFGKYPGNCLPGEGIRTAEASYMDGYETGLNWKEKYTPGGPWVHHRDPYGRHANDPDYIAYTNASLENYNEWHRGFKDGRHLVEPTPNERDHVAVLGYN